MATRQFKSTALIWPFLLAILALAALPADIAVARWVSEGGCPKEIKKLLDISESFAHGYGVLLILITVATLDVSNRARLPRLLAATLGAGGLANVLKLLIQRTRPHHYDFSTDAAPTFGEWLPLFSSPSSQQSFPSTHTVTAAALATALVWLYPRGRFLFPILAALSACQRIVAGAHFPTDVLAGAAIGVLLAQWILRSRWFDRLEAKISAGATS